MSGAVRRGALIVLEGCDRSGKSTQCKRLVQALNDKGVKSELVRFPERDTAIGKVINDYLERKCELEDHAIHLLFAANRWELAPRMRAQLMKGTTLIVDRYSYSGVAFTAAKPGMDMEWCKQSEVGLTEPDAVFYLTLSAEEAAKRSEFGGERYEQTEFQTRVAKNYDLIRETTWQEIDANKSIGDLHEEIFGLAMNIVNSVGTKPMGQLWVQPTIESPEKHKLASKRPKIEEEKEV